MTLGVSIGELISTIDNVVAAAYYEIIDPCTSNYLGGHQSGSRGLETSPDPA